MRERAGDLLCVSTNYESAELLTEKCEIIYLFICILKLFLPCN